MKRVKLFVLLWIGCYIIYYKFYLIGKLLYKIVLKFSNKFKIYLRENFVENYLL